MIIKHNISLNEVSWVKSNKEVLDSATAAKIQNYYIPETIDELSDIVRELYSKGEFFDVIGYSSNTLFYPTYSIRNLIATKQLRGWEENDSTIICECGVSVAALSKQMVANGFLGFEGLINLPGTVASAVYGNSGCYDCTINSLLESVTVIEPDGSLCNLSLSDLKCSFRSTSLKRKEIRGVIISVTLKKVKGNAEKIKKQAEDNSMNRKRTQPSAENNLGTTLFFTKRTFWGEMVWKIQLLCMRITHRKPSRLFIPFVLRLLGKQEYIPYLFDWNRFLFLDAKAHELFPHYIKFAHKLFSDMELEIEIRE